MTLTEAGQSFYEAAIRLTNDLEAAESLVGRGQTAPSRTGSSHCRACVRPPVILCQSYPSFFARYPDISVELQVSERTVNLIEEGIDLAIHNGPLTDFITARPHDSDDFSPYLGDARVSGEVARGASNPKRP